MTSPYHTLLKLIMDRLWTVEYLVGPPSIAIVAEEDQTANDSPGFEDSVMSRVTAAMQDQGIVIVIFVESVERGEMGEDVATVVVQVTENEIKNMDQGGTKKGTLSVSAAIRGGLQNYVSTDHPEWTPLRWESTETAPSGLVMVRESRFTTRSLIPFTFNP